MISTAQDAQYTSCTPRKRSHNATPFAILQFQLGYFRIFDFHNGLQREYQSWFVGPYCRPKTSSESDRFYSWAQWLKPTIKIKSPVPTARHRARFCYGVPDELFSYECVLSKGLPPPHGRPRLAGFWLAEVTFLVSGFQHPPVLYHHADTAGKLERPQKPLHCGGEHFGGTHFPAEFHKASLLVLGV